MAPGHAKRAGRRTKIRPDWETVKIGIMTELVRQKFQNEPFRSLLVATSSSEIEEGNSWGETFWGVDCKTGQDGNELGVILMKIRKELQDGRDP